MKARKVCFSTKTTDGKITDCEEKVEADTIAEALMLAREEVAFLIRIYLILSSGI